MSLTGRSRGTLHCNGVNLSYVEQGSGPGPTLVFLHGYTECANTFDPILSRMPDTYHVIALDLRGHGYSDHPEDGYTLRTFANDVAEFLDQRRLGPVTLIGYSMGGRIARLVAEASPHQVSHLVLISTAPSLADHPLLREYRPFIDGLSDPIPYETVLESINELILNPVPADFVAAICRARCSIPARVHKAVFDAMLADDQVGQLSRLSVPTLVLWGDQDLFTRQEQDDLVNAGDHGELRVHRGSGHMLPWERPARVVADIVRFVGGPTAVNEWAARRLVNEVWNGGNLSVVEELVSPDYVDGAPLPGYGNDRESLKKQVRWIRSECPEFRYTIEDLLAVGDDVVLRYSWHETTASGTVGETAASGTAWYKMRYGQLVARYTYSSGLYADQYRHESRKR